MFTLCELSASFIYVKCSKMNWIMTVLFCPEGKAWLRLQHTHKHKTHAKKRSHLTFPQNTSTLTYTNTLRLLFEQTYQPIVTDSGSIYSICDSTSLSRHITANPKSCYLRLATHFKHNVGVTCSSWAARMFSCCWKTDWV